MTDTKPRILVLEDHEPIAELISFYFEERGYQIKVIYRGSELFQSIKDFKPDLITIDIELPDADGMELFRQLQTQPGTKSIPVVFVSVHESQREMGMELGAKGFIAKPFAEGDLHQAVLDALEN